MEAFILFTGITVVGIIALIAILIYDRNHKSKPHNPQST